LLPNQATIATAAPEVNESNNTSALVSTAVLIPELVLEKFGPASALPGMGITYVLTYVNLGNEVATSVVITDLLPAAIQNVSVLSAGTVITQLGGSAYVWDVADIPPGGSGIITLTGTIAPTFRGTLVNTATILAASPDLDLENNSDTLETFVSIADVAIAKSGPAAAPAGEHITYTLAFTNTDTAPATGVIITDTLPASLLDVVVTSSLPGVTTRPGSAFVWDIPDLAPGESGVLIVTGRVAPTYRGTLLNQATIGTTAPEASNANNTSVLVETFVSMADVTIEKMGPATVEAGGVVTYTLQYRNVDNGIATGVVLTDVLPSALISAAVTYSGPMITPRPGASFAWTVADLAPGAGGVVTITAHVRSDATGSVVNTASISAIGELNTADNSSVPVGTQILVPDVTLEKSGPATIEQGGQITYRLTFTNAGAATARDVVLTDLLPAELTGASFTASGAAVTLRAGPIFVWDIVDLAPGAGGVVTITATLDAAFTGDLTNTAAIATSGADSNSSNNSDQVSTQVTRPDFKVYLPLVTRQGP